MQDTHVCNCINRSHPMSENQWFYMDCDGVTCSCLLGASRTRILVSSALSRCYCQRGGWLARYTHASTLQYGSREREREGGGERERRGKRERDREREREREKVLYKLNKNKIKYSR